MLGARNIRVVRHENCYSGTGAHKLTIRCFTCHIPANQHLRARLASRTHQRITSRARLIRIKQDARASKPVRSNISPEAVTFYPRSRIRIPPHFSPNHLLSSTVNPIILALGENNRSTIFYELSFPRFSMFDEFIERFRSESFLSPSFYVRSSFDQLKKQFEGE